jgi:DNA-binding transcriptional regulator YiaG
MAVSRNAVMCQMSKKTVKVIGSSSGSSAVTSGYRRHSDTRILKTPFPSIPGLAKITSFRRLRDWLGMSLEDVAKLTGYHKSTVAAWQAGRRAAPQEALDKLAARVATRLTHYIGHDVRIIGAKVIVNSPLHVQAWTWCENCGAEYQMKRSTDRYCAKCREEKRR